MIYLTKLITAKTWIEGTLKLLKRKLGYGVGFPYNCGYYDGDTLWGDCWCTQPKTVVWSIFAGKPVWDNYDVGTCYYVDCIMKDWKTIKQGEKSNMHDWDGASIMNNYCEDISFAKMHKDKIYPALLLTSANDHMGCCIGDFEMDGKIYNTNEMSPNGKLQNKMRSYVDENGACWTHKGGDFVRYWGRCGRMTGIIDYTNSGEDIPTPQPTKPWSIDNVAVHIMRGYLPDGTEIPKGFDNRVEFFAQYGYTKEEIRKAQDIINLIYGRHDMDVLACELAMKFISGEAGDGVTIRRQWIADNYPEYDTEQLFRATQDKVNKYADY